MAKFLENVPYTEAGKKLNLPDELKAKCRLVYRKHEDGGYIFHDLWDENKEYGDDCVILPVQSYYDSIEWIEPSRQFVNILCSTKDPEHEASSWIELMKLAYQTEGICRNEEEAQEAVSECCTDGFFYIPNTYDEKVKDKNDNEKIHDGYYRVLGGHVLFDKEDAQEGTKGGFVYLLPICNKHNSYFRKIDPNTYEERQPGKGFYMKVGDNGACAVRLKNYFRNEHEGCS